MQKDRRPNIIIFNPDQMRADALHHLGNPASVTPNMDALLADGVSFAHAYCQNPVCSPSRCSFMSGWYPHVRGHRTMHHLMKADEPVLLGQLRDAGYYVWMQNRNDLLPAQENRFGELADEIFSPSVCPSHGVVGGKRGTRESGDFYSFYRGRLSAADGGPVEDMDQLTVNGAVDFIRHRPADGQPFCMFVPLMYPHPPYQVEEPYFSAIDRTKLPLRRMPPDDWSEKASILKGIYEEQGLADWPEERWDELRAVYLAMCMRVDRQLGQIIAALKERGLYDDSFLFVFSDHGDYTGDYGIAEKNQNTFEEPLVNVPFLIKPSKGYPVEPGRRDQLVELIDFYATVHDLARFDYTHTQFGRSLLPVLADKDAAHRDAVFSEGGRLHQEPYCADLGGTTVLNPENEYYPRLKQQASAGPEHTKATMCRTKRYKYVRRLYERDEFYDLLKDPLERHNLIDDPALQPEIARHREAMLNWYQETCDAVPKKLDQRFNIEMLLQKRGIRLSKKNMDIVTAAFADKTINSNTMPQIFEMIQKLKSEE